MVVTAAQARVQARTVGLDTGLRWYDEVKATRAIPPLST
jgi:hypothetical protein